MSDTFSLQDETEAIVKGDDYTIPNEHDPQNENIGALLDGAIDPLAESSDAILEDEVFDVFRSLLKHSESVPAPLMSKLLDSILSGIQNQSNNSRRAIDQDDQDSFGNHKEAMERFAFLLFWFVTSSEKVKGSEENDEGDAPAPKAKRGRGGKAGAARNARLAGKSESWDWSDHIPNVLNTIALILKKLTISRIWSTTSSRDHFVTCLTRPAYYIMENEQYMKTLKTREGVFQVVALAVKHHNHGPAARINMMQNLQFHEHLSEYTAEILHLLSTQLDHNQLGDDMLREISSTTFNAQDTKGPRTMSKFLIKYAELLPKLVLKQMPILQVHLDSEAYPMRVAMIEVIYYIINDILSEEESPRGNILQALFDPLVSRMMDISSYVRTKVLVVFSRICKTGRRLPLQRPQMTNAAIGALDDKSSIVRKSAVALMTKLIETHPFGLMNGGYLELAEWEKGYADLKEELAAVEAVGDAVVRDGEETQEEGGDGGDTEREDDGNDEEDESDDDRSKRDEDAMDVDDADSLFSDDANPDTPKKKPKKKKKAGPRKSELDIAAFSKETAVLAALDGDDLARKQLQKKFFADALQFINQVEGAMDTICQLLGSTNKAEVLEAMDFFRVAHDYKLPADPGVKKMLHLIWSKDNNSTSEDGKELKSVRSRLLECYRIMYIDDQPNMDAKSQINRIAKNFIELTYNATLAELTSLEEMMKALMEENHIDEAVIAKLWQVYTSTHHLPKAQRRGAIIIIGMLALAKRAVVTDHVDTILKVGLGRLGKLDLTLARYSCVALQRLNGSAKKVKGSLQDKTLRLEMYNAIFQKLQSFIQAPCRSKEWFGLAEQIINTIYALGDHPDTLCSAIIKHLARQALSKPSSQQAPNEAEDSNMEQPGNEKDPDAMDEDEASKSDPFDHTQGASQNPDQHSKDTGDAFELAKLLFVVGHVAIKQIAFLELVEREWKRQKDERHAAEKAAAGGNAAQKASNAEELDQVAGNAEDEIGDRVAEVRESELLYGPHSLLAVFGPMLVHICGSPQKFKNRTLRAAATLSLSKFLCVSSQFCDNHHHLLFKILEVSKDPDLRSNLVIALGDVAVSFSNIIDENSNELYKGLSDENIAVKKNTLMVLTHLILNGMIKVKGQLGEMAKCLEDKDTRIADLAKLFFTELATKDNAIYNNLPDVISHLSSGEHAVDEETFQSTLRYIFTFIEKEKQAENIVEKLCQRFRLTDDARQWRDIAFCLSLLPFKSERSVKKLIEGFPLYRDKLHEEGVSERFVEILQKARLNKSANKPDTELNEFESMLQEYRRQGEEDKALEQRAQKKKKKATRKSSRKKAAPVEEDDEEE